MVSFFAGDALISRGRSQACTKFLEDTKVPYMLFVDEDIIFSPDQVTKIYKSLESGKDIVGGIYPVRGASQFSSYGWGGIMDADGTVRDIEYLATGFMGISRRALIKIKEDLNLRICNPNDWARCYPFFECGYWEDRKREKGGEALYISEDWEFCEKARRVGFRVYADTSIQLGHIREIIYSGPDVAKNQYNAFMQKEVYGPISKHRELIMSIDTDLHEFLNITLQASQDNIKKPQGKHIFESALYHSQPMFFQDHLNPLTGIKKEKILVMGCGVGTAVYMLAEQGNEVVGWDSDSKTIEFCNFKKKKYNLSGEFTTEKPLPENFNLIIMTNYLNHLDSPDKVLGEITRKGTKIYHVEDKPLAEMSNWCMQNNLTEWDERWIIKP